MATTFKEATKELEQRGINYTRDFKYIDGEDGKRVRIELDVITNVKLPFTAREWCELCMREGSYYIGGCCGNMSAVQDHLNGVFRASGLIDARVLRYIADLCIPHEGFEDFEDPTLFDKPWTELDPFQKIGLIWQASKDFLHVGNFDVPHEKDLTEFQEAIRTGSTLVSALGWSAFFSYGDKTQRKCIRIESKARLLAALHTIYGELQKSEEAIAGWGLRSRQTGVVAENYVGLCLFATKAAVEDLIETLKRNDDFKVKEWEIAPFVVSVQEGLVWK